MYILISIGILLFHAFYKPSKCLRPKCGLVSLVVICVIFDFTIFMYSFITSTTRTPIEYTWIVCRLFISLLISLLIYIQVNDLPTEEGDGQDVVEINTVNS
jgi:hypothetical protein